MAKRKKPDTDGAPQSLRIEGEMTIYTAAELKQRLVGALNAGGDLEIDLSDVSEIDSAGLQLLILAKREGTRRNKNVGLTGHSAAVIECLDLCNITAEFGDQVVLAAAH